MNCKPGDLAICMAGESTPQMAGRIVRVVRAACDGEKLDGHFVDMAGYTGRVWVVEGSTPLPVMTTNAGLKFFRFRAYVDRLMRPVSGLPDTKTTEHSYPIKEVA